MSVKSFYIRNMLLKYDKQLVTARRLARYNQALRLLRGEEEESVPPDVKRGMMVERIAREVMESLILSGSDNAVVQEIKKQLEEEVGETLIFKYPPTELDLQVFRETPQGPVEVSPAEKAVIMEKLWNISLDKVDSTML
ncbi:MAG: DVU0524 family FlgM-associated protein [Halodesulfovibrio sp.]